MDLKKYIQECWKSSDPTRFPGPQPVSIERRHFPLLKRQPYVVCEKTDGVRHFLVCPPGSKEVFLVNRNFETKSVSLAGFPKDTLLDGELVTTKDKSRDLFMVYDAVRVKGVDLMNEPLSTRLGFALAAVRAVIKSRKDPFELKIKNMVPLENIHQLLSLDSFEYETDGLVMTPINEPVRMGTHETLFKWKPHNRITVDFMIRGGRELWVQDRGQPYIEAELHLTNQRPDLPDKTIVECGYGPVGWFVEKVRTDKNYPNNRRTYYNTCTNLRENIQLEEFYTM
jgi:mRNA capping enzyme, catalytic domain/mRNA capping enzyme, C-terminal domain